MSRKEMSRLEWMEKVKRKGLSLWTASSKMSLSYRQAKRLKKRFEEQGASGLVHGLRGKPSNGRSMQGSVSESWPSFERNTTTLAPR
ncbi:MAG: hypothetical protein EXR99_07475, partial [Gemmataceae bacterium]|nr:hypothetical protein [Gemmataceae bacterium]